jgi:FlaA1/EpsC-like NDP-sugar epimerase
VSLEGKRVLVTGGTGSLGKTVVRRILGGELGTPAKVTVFSRDEAKQHFMRLAFMNLKTATDEVIYKNFLQTLDFRIGDVRDPNALRRAMQNVDVVIHAAALKQVPSCERYPWEAVQTNIIGSHNVVDAVANSGEVETVIAISTDKACKPINVMGMTKAMMERLMVEANLQCAKTRFVCVRYGNVVSSRGSVVPLFVDQIARGGPVTITQMDMTRFLLSLDTAVDIVFAAYQHANPGETFVPRAAAARVPDIARALMGAKEVPMTETGIRPGEKIHEIMVSEEEVHRTSRRNEYYVLHPMLPELGSEPAPGTALKSEYSSQEVTVGIPDLKKMLAPYRGRPDGGDPDE